MSYDMDPAARGRVAVEEVGGEFAALVREYGWMVYFDDDVYEDPRCDNLVVELGDDVQLAAQCSGAADAVARLLPLLKAIVGVEGRAGSRLAREAG